MARYLRLSLILLLLLSMAVLTACGGDDDRVEDAAPIPDDVVAQPPEPAAAETVEQPPAAPAASSPAPEEAAAPGSEPVITFNISGGIIGFCDELTVFASSNYRLQSCQDPLIEGRLEQANQALVQEWAENLAGFTVSFEDNPGGADSLKTELVFNGAGSTEADDVQKQIIFDWVNGFVLSLRQPVADIPTPTPPPPIGPDGLCPEIQQPAMIVANYDNPSGIIIIDPASQVKCDVVLHQPPFGRIVSAGNNIFYPVFDPNSSAITIWQLNRTGESQPLDFTSVTMEEFGPFNFTVSADGSRIAWAWATINAETNPEAPLYYNNLRAANIDGSNLLNLLEQAENNERRYLEPVRFSTDNETLFYAMQPDGLGGMIFSFSGRFDTMYRLPLPGGEAQLIYACPENEQAICIGDVSADGNFLAVARHGEGSVEVLDGSGSLVSTLTPPASDYVGWPVFGPDEKLAFVSAQLAQPSDEAPPRPSPGYISLVEPPYTGQPQTVYTDNSVTTLWEWLDGTRLAYGAMDEQGSIGTAVVTLNGEATILSPNYALAVLR